MNKVDIFHQCGFRHNWNKEVYQNKNIGEGFIISPIDMSNDTLEEFDISKSFIDPQFYSLNIYKDNYLSYKFLDEIDNIYDYMAEKNNIAKRCIEYQKDKGFKYITIPAIDFNLLSLEESYDVLYDKVRTDDDIPSSLSTNNKINLIDKLIIKSFVKCIKEQNIEKKVLITIIFDDEMAKSQLLFDGLLSLLTNEDIIAGVYLIPQIDRTYKRITDINFLTKIMQFINVLSNNNMEVIVGYSDIESILYTVAGATGITVGIYENLRKYDGNRFIEYEYKGRGPSSRVFSYKLLQWIEHVYIPVIKDKYKLDDYFYINEYFEETQDDGYKWHFNKPQCYKHYMISYNEIIKKLPNSFEERYLFVDGLLKEADDAFKELADNIFFDGNSDGTHINKWRTALKSFYDKIKEE